MFFSIVDANEKHRGVRDRYVSILPLDFTAQIHSAALNYYYKSIALVFFPTLSPAKQDGEVVETMRVNQWLRQTKRALLSPLT